VRAGPVDDGRRLLPIAIAILAWAQCFNPCSCG